jgi:hypothetical protein
MIITFCDQPEESRAGRYSFRRKACTDGGANRGGLFSGLREYFHVWRNNKIAVNASDL